MTLNDLSEEQMEQLTKDVKRVAKAVSFSWPETVVADDLEQDLYMEILQSPATLKAITGAEPAARTTLLTRLAHRTAGKERDDYDHFTGQYNYSVDDVKRLLLSGVLDADSAKGPEASRLDLEDGLLSLWDSTPQYAEAITKRYAEGWESPQGRSDQNALMNGITALTTEMNRSYKRRAAAHADGPGTRKVVSNSAAQNINRENS